MEENKISKGIFTFSLTVLLSMAIGIVTCVENDTNTVDGEIQKSLSYNDWKSLVLNGTVFLKDTGAVYDVSKASTDLVPQLFLIENFYGTINLNVPGSATTTTEQPSTITQPPVCLFYSCNCCVFNPTDLLLVGQIGVRSPNYPNDYGNNLNCKFSVANGYAKVNITFTTFVVAENTDSLKFLEDKTGTIIKSFTGYTVPAPFSVDTTAKTLELEIISGSNSAASVPINYGARRWELFISIA